MQDFNNKVAVITGLINSGLCPIWWTLNPTMNGTLLMAQSRISQGVIPAKAAVRRIGIQWTADYLDPRLRGDDELN